MVAAGAALTSAVLMASAVALPATGYAPRRVASLAGLAGPAPGSTSAPTRWLRLVERERWPLGVASVWVRGSSSRRFEATSTAVVEVLEALAAELLAGRPPAAALRRAFDSVDDPVLRAALRPVSTAAREGGDVARELTAGSSSPGCQALRWLAAAWGVADGTGAALAGVVERVASAARAEADHRRQVRTELAGPRATARLLAALPLLGLAIGTFLGADPVSVLFGTPAGLGCLFAGLGLEVLGVRWTARLAASAERS